MKHNISKSKKVFMLMAAMLLLSMPLRSQVFLTQEDLDSERDGQWSDIGLIIPIHEQDFDQAEPWAPVGSGIAVLAALGGAYLLGKRKKED
jgi:hypothetical protein